MFVASYANGYGQTSAVFDDEVAAEKWLVEEQRRTGMKLGVVYEVNGEAS